MSKYNGGGNLAPDQIASLAQQAGFTGQALVTATAIALAESGGQPRVINDTPSTGDYSVGLWQINYFQSLYQGRSQQFGTPDQLASDPAAQARAAYTLSGGGRSFTPWSTYKNNAYLSQIPTAVQAVQDIGVNVPGSATYTNATLPPNSAQQGSNAVAQQQADTNCLAQTPSIDLYVASIPPICLFKKSWAHGLLGGVAMLGGFIVIGAGIFVLIETRLPGNPAEFGNFAKKAPAAVPNYITNYRITKSSSESLSAD